MGDYVAQKAVLLVEGSQEAGGLQAAASAPLGALLQPFAQHADNFRDRATGPIGVFRFEAGDESGGRVEPVTAGAGPAEHVGDAERILDDEVDTQEAALARVRAAADAVPAALVGIEGRAPLGFVLRSAGQHGEKVEGWFELVETGRDFRGQSAPAALPKVQHDGAGGLGTVARGAGRIEQGEDIVAAPLQAPELHLVGRAAERRVVLQRDH